MMRGSVFAAALLIVLSNDSGAQTSGLAPQVDPSVRYADVPFGVGERMTYKVSLGIGGDVGNGVLEVADLETVHGRPTYALRFQLKGGLLFAKVDDDFRSWLDAQSLVSRRFKQDQKEYKYERHRTFEFFPEERRWQRLDNDETGTLPTDQPLDDVSFLYFIRTLPLEVGKTYSFNRYFKEDGNPVTVKVLRKQTITVPAGRFQTIVVQPIIKTKGLFSEGGRAEVYFTDDDRRILVQLKSKVKFLKSLDLTLETYTPGQPIAQMR